MVVVHVLDPAAIDRAVQLETPGLLEHPGTAAPA
jgi:hypothetical protein